MWVFVGHTLNLCAVEIPLLSQPKLAVDLFIIMSGFLMVYVTYRRRDREPWGEVETWRNFMLRRFFRLTPLFYVTLLLAIALGPWFWEMRDPLTALGSNVPDQARYHDQGPVNIALHLSYLFGLFPEYSFRTPLPDWSIGLEMQFYLAFPLIFLLWGRGAVWVCAAVTAGAAAMWVASPTWMASFPEPSLLALKINLFLAGMVLAMLFVSDRQPRSLIAGAGILAALPLDGNLSPTLAAVRVVSVGLVALLLLQAAGRAKLGTDRLLSAPIAQWLGDVSYSVYLIHLLVLVPVAGAVAMGMGEASAIVRAIITFAVAAPIVLALSHVTFRWIERPGIKLGERVIGSRRAARVAT